MKFTKYSLIAAIALSGALVACNEDDSVYAPGAPASGNQVYFPLTESTTVALEENATTAKVVVARVETEEAATVGVSGKVTDAKGAVVTDVFTIPSTVSFAAGQAEAELTLGVNFANVEPDAVYNVALQLNNGTTPYGASSRTFAVSYAPWSAWELVPGELGEYTFSTILTSYNPAEMYVVKRNSTVNPDKVQYATAGFFYKQPGNFPTAINEDFIFNMNLKETIDVDGVACPIVDFVTTELPVTNGDSDEYFIFADYFNWYVETLGYSKEEAEALFDEKGLARSYFNPETGLFTLNIICFSAELEPGYAYGRANQYLQLPGYANYEIMLDYVGNFVDAKGNEVAVINAAKTDDVASFTIDIFAGSLKGSSLEAAIEDMKANEDLEVYTDALAHVAFTCPDAGKYTVVAIGNNAAGETACTASLEFDYKTVQAANPWTSMGYVEYTDGYFCSLFSFATPCTWDVEIEESTEVPGMYRLVNPYGEDWPDLLYKSWIVPGDNYLYIDATDPNHVMIPLSEIGINLNAAYGNLQAYSYLAYFLDQGYSLATIEGAFGDELNGTLKDGKITFPVGALLMGMPALGKYYDANMYGYEEDEDGNVIDEGTATFCVDFGTASAAPKKVAPAKSVTNMSFSNMIKASAKLAENVKASNGAKTISTEVYNQYLLANPTNMR